MLLLFYLLAVNVLSLVLMALDKSRARRGRWRIPEKGLFLAAVLGGSAGGIAGMYLFRHKTRRRRFVFGLPAILLLQLSAAALLYRWAGPSFHF